MFRRKRGLAWLIVAIVLIGIFVSRQVVKEAGIKEEIERKQAQKVAVLGDSLVEICLELGLKDNLAAVSYLGADIPELAGITHLGGPLNLSEEQLVEANVDLIIASDSVQLRERMKSTVSNEKIHKLFLKHENFEDILNCINQISIVMGVEKEGAKLAGKLVAEIDINRAVAENAPRVLLVYSAQPGESDGFVSFACVDENTFLDELLRSAGGRNAIEGSSGKWPQLSVEDLIRLNPDIIVDFRPDFQKDTEEIKEIWRKTAPASTVKAIALEQIAVITHHHALLPSPKVVEVHAILQKIIEDYRRP
ncbi:MAG: ABC transporter substrate-binding protein [Planctomycetes bacterium]|nr:ABC transporter substrate-binding protein [Planctomycetota bacterium]